jgi:hypothetical protein
VAGLLFAPAKSLYTSPRLAFFGELQMSEIHPLAGQTVPPSMLADIPRLVTAYFVGKPDPKVAAQ